MEPGDGDEADFPYHNEKWRSKPMRKNYDSERIREIFALTLELGGVDPKTVRRSKSEVIFWNTLLKLWKKKEIVIGCDIMYASLFLLFWGCCLKQIKANMKAQRLCSLVLEELLERKDIVEMLKNKMSFKRAYNNARWSSSPYVVGDESLSARYYRDFLEDRMMFILFGGERIINNLDLYSTGMDELIELKKKAMARYRCEEFMRLITKLIAESCSWHDEDWLNENNIITALQLKMGIDFSKNYKLFDRMFELMIWTDDNVSYNRKMIYIDEMPLTILKAVWPGNTEEIIEEMFRTACCDLKNLYPNEFSLANSSGENAKHELKFFVRSWLYKQIKVWNESKTYHLNIETKKCLFSFEMGI